MKEQLRFPCSENSTYPLGKMCALVQKILVVFKPINANSFRFQIDKLNCAGLFCCFSRILPFPPATFFFQFRREIQYSRKGSYILGQSLICHRNHMLEMRTILDLFKVTPTICNFNLEIFFCFQPLLQINILLCSLKRFHSRQLHVQS